MRLPRCLLVLGSAAMLAGALMLTAGSTVTTAAEPGRAVQPASHRPSARFLAEARTALVRYTRDDHPQVALVRTGAPAIKAGTSRVSTYNWSGYADVSAAAGTFTEVSGQWRTPVVACSREDTVTSEWVGLDGFSDQTVEQDGTLSWCFEGTPTYFTWYEMYPAGTIEVGKSLQPGDMIMAGVSVTGTTYTLALADSTRPANSFSVQATCAAAACLDTSAEWIAERPAFTTGIAPLADYLSWTLHDATETADGALGTISSYSSSYRIDMADATDSYQLSTTSPLTGNSGFTAYWRNSY
jgi:hypothetical protein